MVYRALEKIKGLLSSLSLRERLSLILKTLSEILSAQALLYIMDKDGQTMNLIEESGKGWEDARQTYPVDGSLPGLCIKKQRILSVGDKGDALSKDIKGMMDEELKGFKRAVYLPLGGGVDGFSGCLCLKSKKVKGFTLKEKRTIKTLSLYITDTLSFLHGLDSCKRKVGELTTLYELSRALMTTVNMERLLYIILTAITAGEGLGFNRAMLFMVDDKAKELQGMMGIGPDSPEEAQRIWEETRKKDLNLWRIISDEGEPPNLASSGLNQMVKSH